MTRREKIRAFIKALSVHLKVKFIREDQSGERPSYPFMSYKILSSDAGTAQEVIETKETVPDDDTKIIKTSARRSTLVVSLSFFADEKGYENLIEAAEEAYSWIDSRAGLAVANEYGIGVSVLSPVQDRTVFFETAHEHRFGFDIEIKDVKITTEEVDTVDIGQLTEEIIKEGEENDGESK